MINTLPLSPSILPSKAGKLATKKQPAFSSQNSILRFGEGDDNKSPKKPNRFRGLLWAALAGILTLGYVQKQAMEAKTALTMEAIQKAEAIDTNLVQWLGEKIQNSKSQYGYSVISKDSSPNTRGSVNIAEGPNGSAFFVTIQSKGSSTRYILERNGTVPGIDKSNDKIKFIAVFNSDEERTAGRDAVQTFLQEMQTLWAEDENSDDPFQVREIQKS